MKNFLVLTVIFSLAFVGCGEEEGDASDFFGKWIGNYQTGGLSTGTIILEIWDGFWTLEYNDRFGKDIENGKSIYDKNKLSLDDSGYGYIVTLSASEKLILECKWDFWYNRPAIYQLSKVKPEPPDIKNSSLLINNLSDFALLNVEYGSAIFGTINSGRDVTKDVNSGTKYVYFNIQTAKGTSVRCRTDVVTCEETKKNEFIITNNTLITVTISETKDTLRNIYNAE